MIQKLTAIHGTAFENKEKPEIVGSPMSSATDSSTPALVKAAQANLYPNYAQPPIVMDHGQGAQLWDASGKRYIDFFAGIAVATLGHNHPQLTTAIAVQAKKVIQLSNYYYTAPNIELAERLCQLTGMDRAFFCNSGTEAVEAALKLTRRYFFALGATDRNVIIAFTNSFHGRTMGSLAATGQSAYRDGFGDLSGVVHAPFGDLEEASRLMNDQVAGVIFEPILGEGGVIPAPAGFAQGLRDLCDKSGALLIADEIQTGAGRTGKFLWCQHEDIKPDVVTMAKGLGGGFPIGSMLCKETLAGALPPGSHGTTYGGNPLGSAAALAILQAFKEDNLLKRVEELGQRFTNSLNALASKHSAVDFRRGRGLMQGLVLAEPSQGGALLAALRDAGLLVTLAGGTTIRITPPLILSDSDFDEGLTILDQVLGDFS